ncbi:hypothetical protein ACTXG7_24005 [Mycolicibacterium sp. Dal123E01]|uniref:hypothetical protein n=1 Tax=Mycolicibacterium sp. Dal123E01 TaxID=3457578 RepID=UPI00403E8C65
MDDSEIEAFQPRAYPPSILIGGAGLVGVLAGIVVSVLMVSAASVAVPPPGPAVRIPPAVSARTVTPVADQPTPANNLEIVVTQLTPRMPAFDQLLQAP